MQFGLFYEHQLPRPWSADDEYKLLQQALEQVELGDALGFDYIWEVEHHFLEEYSHSSAPEVFLAACARNTKRIRIGHGVVLAPPGYNHPARVAERIATLDLISGGRVEWGTGESGSRVELEGFGLPLEEKKAMWAEAVEQSANMMAMTPYPGYHGRYFSMPCRNVVPKPMQKPHPPIWVACSRRETIHAAARAGVGALSFAFVDPSEAAKWVKEYYDIIRSDECTPIGHFVNANVAMVTGFSVHEDREEAKRRGAEGFKFFGYGVGHYYVYGAHRPGVTDLNARFQQALPDMPDVGAGSGIGTPEDVAQHLEAFERAGVDQVIFIQQSGRTKHEHICEAMRLFADRVMPAFKARDAEARRRKQAELAPYIERAMARKRWMKPIDPDAVPTVPAYGRTILNEDQDMKAKTTHHAAADIIVPLEDLAERKRSAAE